MGCCNRQLTYSPTCSEATGSQHHVQDGSEAWNESFYVPGSPARPATQAVRLEKIAHLREAIAAGAYRVPAELIAESLVRFGRGERRAGEPAREMYPA